MEPSGTRWFSKSKKLLLNKSENFVREKLIRAVRKQNIFLLEYHFENCYKILLHSDVQDDSIVI